MKYDLVVFDLDGTLIDTIEDLGNAVNHALALRGLPLHTIVEYRAMVGHGIRNLVKSALPEEFRADDAFVDAALADFRSYYVAHIDDCTRPYPGMVALLTNLYRNGVKVAVASNKFQQGAEMLIGEFFPDVEFTDVLGNRPDAPLKPDPQIVLSIMEKAGTSDGSRVAMVGDSATDIRTGLNAGVTAIGVGWGFRPASDMEKAGAAAVASSCDELSMLLCDIPASLMEYVETEIVPRYEAFDKAHKVDHARTVISQSIALARFYDVDIAMLYTAAAYHDTGLVEGREVHNWASGRIIRADSRLREWFDEEQIETIAQAAEDHRASAKSEPRSIYGRILAEADRVIDPVTIIRRTVQFGLSHYPELDKEGNWQRTVEHLHEKYAGGGYLHLYIPESDNAARLAELRGIIRDEAMLRRHFEAVWEAENA